MPAALHPFLSADALRPVAHPGSAGPGDDDDDDDDGPGGGSGGNIDPDDDEGFVDEDDDDDEEPLQCAASVGGDVSALHCTKSWYNGPMRRPASFDGCPPHASRDPGNRIIGF